MNHMNADNSESTVAMISHYIGVKDVDEAKMASAIKQLAAGEHSRNLRV